ncbi:MAG: hypothetical protein LQ338_006998 [Usnochroma carphineum]|nr:MAG: hypothetical protein LQ338_006998 [Usnochroma carphineum]
MDFSNFDEQLSAHEGTSTFNSTMPTFYLNDSSVPMEELTGGPMLSDNWQPAANLETSIDPALLTTFDASLDLSTSPKTLQPTATSLWDASTGSEWTPMDTKTSIAPKLINPFDTATDPFAVQASFANGNIVFPSQSVEFSAFTAHAPFSPEVPNVMHRFLSKTPAPTAAEPKVKQHHVRPATNRTTAAKWVSPYSQPLVDGRGCPCSLCKGGPVDFSSLQKSKKPAKAPAPRTKRAVPTAKATARKRKAKELTPEDDSEDSDSSLSSVPTLDDDSGPEDRALSDYEPASKVGRKGRGAAPKRRRVLRKAVESGKVPKGLEIDMKAW